jgi:ABC-type hemin transport system ATPase subunit
VVAATHDAEFAARCFERVVILHGGRVVADGLTHQVFSQHRLLEGASLEPTAMSRLAAACGLPITLLTIPEMVAYLVEV